MKLNCHLYYAYASRVIHEQLQKDEGELKQKQIGSFCWEWTVTQDIPPYQNWDSS